MTLSKITSLFFKAARFGADLNAVNRAVRTGSPTPIFRRLVNKGIGRGLVSKLFLRK